MRIRLLPLAAAIARGVATAISESLVEAAWFPQAAQGPAFIFLSYRLASHFIASTAIVALLRWIGVPLAALYMVGWLDDVVTNIDSIAIEIGNIRITLYAVMRTVMFEIVLFWLERVSSTTGQHVNRNQPAIDSGTRKVVAKPFGGALGVGLDFRLQQIAASYIELEDGRTRIPREMSMRSATLVTFDGKDIMFPNERLITTALVYWTHIITKQRYSLRFQVAYDTDLDVKFDFVRATVASRPKVLSGDNLPIQERPEAEIERFGVSGIDILVECWMEGIDDRDNRVGGDLLPIIGSTSYERDGPVMRGSRCHIEA